MAEIENFTIAIVQMMTTENLTDNLDKARQMIETASRQAQIVVLPEMFCCPYDTGVFPRYAQPAGGTVWQMLSETAARCGVWLVGGSMPEAENGHIYNTCFCFDPQGRQAARHRKVHLFDISIRGGQHFMESETLSAGDSITVFDTPYMKVGVAICYDCRFPELIRSMVLAGAELIVVPASFNDSTGPLHWELMFRSRAVDNQVYMVGAAPARNEAASYHSWSRSIVVSPWGQVLHQMDTSEGILYAEIDSQVIDEVRSQLPLLKHRRPELYVLND